MVQNLQKGFIEEVVATGQDISDIVSKIEPVLEGLNVNHVMISLLSLTLTLMNPALSPDDLKDGVRKVSEYICVWMDSKNDGGKPLSKLSIN